MCILLCHRIVSDKELYQTRWITHCEVSTILKDKGQGVLGIDKTQYINTAKEKRESERERNTHLPHNLFRNSSTLTNPDAGWDREGKTLRKGGEA